MSSHIRHAPHGERSHDGMSPPDFRALGTERRPKRASGKKKKKQVTSKDQDQKGFGLYNSNEIPGSKVFESLREVPPRIP